MAEQFVIENGVLNKYLGNEDVVTIPKEVTTIGSNAFEKNGTLQMLILNEGLEVIEPYAFFKCENLESVRFPSTLKKIGMLAFGSCTSLGAVSLPEGLEVIGDMAFTGCNNLHSVKLPDTVKRVSMSAFPPTLKVNQKKEGSQQDPKTDKTVFSADAAAEEKSILEKGQDVSIPKVAQKATTSIEEEKPSEKAAEKEMVPSAIETRVASGKKQEPDPKIPQEQSGKRSGRKKMPVRFIYILVLLVIGAGIFFVRNNQSKKNAAAVSFKIDSIGVVTIDSEPAITAAEKEYAALKKKEKEMVANHSALVDARSSYTTISKIVIGLENFDTVSLDNLGQAKSIISLIDQLPEAERGQYVTRRNEIETEYNNLVENTKNTVEKSISAIGTVSLAKENLITAARQKYDSCPDEIQKLISNENVLTDAETEYAELKEKAKKKQEEEKKKAEAQKKKEEEEKKKKDKEEAYKKLDKYRTDEDEIEDVKWYFCTGFPEDWRYDTFALPYIARRVGANEFYLKMLFNRIGGDWIFFDSILIVTDNNRYTITPNYNDISRDYNKNCVETYHYGISTESDIKMLKDMGKSNKTTVRFQGKYNDDLVLSSSDKKQILDFVSIFEAVK